MCDRWDTRVILRTPKSKSVFLKTSHLCKINDTIAECSPHFLIFGKTRNLNVGAYCDLNEIFKEHAFQNPIRRRGISI
jgi:hypothetical protein